MRKLSLVLSVVLFMLVFTCNTYGGFDVGGGPGFAIERIMDFLRSSQKYLVEGNVSDNEIQKSLRLSSYHYQKNYVSTGSSADHETFWDKIIQNGGDNNFVILVIGENLYPKNLSYVLVAFDAFDVVNGDLVFDLSTHAKSFQLDLKNRKFIEIAFEQFYKDLCLDDLCPNVHFISAIK